MRDLSTLFSVGDVWTFAPLPEQPRQATVPQLRPISEEQKADMLEAIASRPDGLTFPQMDLVGKARCHTDGERNRVISALLADGRIVAVPSLEMHEWSIYATPENWRRVASQRVAPCQTTAEPVASCQAASRPASPESLDSVARRAILAACIQDHSHGVKAAAMAKLLPFVQRERRQIILADMVSSGQLEVSVERGVGGMRSATVYRASMRQRTLEYIQSAGRAGSVAPKLDGYHQIDRAEWAKVVDSLIADGLVTAKHVNGPHGDGTIYTATSHAS